MTFRPVFLMLAAAATALPSIVVSAAESTERTSMPDFCTRRDVNCVLPDGPLPRIVTPLGSVPQQPTTTVQTESSTAGINQRGALAGTTTVTTDSSGVTTVFTPVAGTPITPAGAPSTGTPTGTGTTGTTTTSSTGGTGFTGGAAAPATAATGAAAASGGGFGRR